MIKRLTAALAIVGSVGLIQPAQAMTASIGDSYGADPDARTVATTPVGFKKHFYYKRRHGHRRHHGYRGRHYGYDSHRGHDYGRHGYGRPHRGYYGFRYGPFVFKNGFSHKPGHRHHH